MTIRGFRSFIEENKHILTNKVNLRDTTLIVDGDNFYVEFLNILTEQPDNELYRSKIYGSDMVSFGQALTEFCKKLLSCNINPIFVFKGANPNKLTTKGNHPLRLDEKSKTLNCFKNCFKGLEESPQAGTSAFGILLKTTARNILEDLGIEMRRTPLNCEKKICNLSHELKCPIISSDSDYMLMNTYMGFIMNKNIIRAQIANTKLEDSFSIECDMYSQDLFLKRFSGLKKEIIPLFGAIMDDSYVPKHITFRLTSALCTDEPDSTDLIANETIKPFHKKIVNILKHLSKFDDIEDALESVMDRIEDKSQEIILNSKPRNWEEIKNFIKQRFRVWSQDDSSQANALQFLRTIYPDDIVLMTNDDNPSFVRNFLIRKIKNDEISTSFTNILFKSIVYERPYVEVWRWPSPNELKKRFYGLALALFRPKSPIRMTESEKEVSKQSDTCTIYNRSYGESHKFFKISPLHKLNEQISLDDMDVVKLIGLKRPDARDLLLATFYCNMLDWEKLNYISGSIFGYSTRYNAAVCFMALKYIIIESKMIIKDLINGILLTLVYYGAKQDDLDKDFDSNQVLQSLIDLIGPLTKLTDPIKSKEASNDLREHTHRIAMLSVALWGFVNINCILGAPMGRLRAESFFDCRMIYLWSQLSSKLTKEDRYDELFPKIIREPIEKLRNELIEYFPEVNRSSPKEEAKLNEMTNLLNERVDQ